MHGRIIGHLLTALAVVVGLTIPLQASAAPALRPDMIRSLESMQQRLASDDDGVASDAKSAADRLEGGNAADRWARALFLQLAATAQARQGNDAGAADLFATARGVDGVDAERRHQWLNQEARLRLRAGQTQAGAELLARWLEFGRGEAEDFWLQAQTLATLQRWSEAADWVDRARESSPSASAGHRELATTIYQRAGREDAALAMLDTLLTGDADDPDTWRRAAGLAQQLGQSGRAAAIWETAWRRGVLSSDDDLLQLIRLHLSGGTPARGAEYLAEALEQGRLENSQTNKRLLAEAWSAARQRDKALAAWREVASHSASADDWQRLGELAYGWGRWRTAIDALSQAQRAGGDVARGGLLEGVAYIELGERRAAQRAFEAARQAGSKQAEAWLSTLEGSAESNTVRQG